MTTQTKATIHIRTDQNPLNSEREFACGIGPDLPEGHVYIFDGEGNHRATCAGCNPDGPKKYGTPINELSGRPGHPGHDEFCRIAKSWGYD